MEEKLTAIFQHKGVRTFLVIGLCAVACLAAFLFPGNEEEHPPLASSHRGIPITSMSKISVSDDEKLIGAMFDRGGQVMIKVVTIGQELIYEGSLQKFNPHRVAAFNKITFSPNGRFAAFSINARDNNLRSRIFLLDLSKKEILDLARQDLLGQLASNYESEEGPVWLDDSTLAYVHKTENSPQELVFVDINQGKEIMPRKIFCYKPTLSHSRKILAYSATGERGKSKVFLMGADFKDAGSNFSPAVINLEGEFNNVSQFAWSPDDSYLAFSFQDDQSSRQGLSPVIVYDVHTRKPVCRINDYLSRPQWLNNNLLMAGFWAFTPFLGQNVHTFAKFIVFDVAAKSMTNLSIKAKNENLIALHDSGLIVTVEDDTLLIADFDLAFTGKPIERISSASGFDRAKEEGGAPASPAETSLDVNTWKTYQNNNFGISFKYPSDWNFNVASGDGYLNAIMGKGTDGIEIRLTTIDGKSFDQQVFEKTIMRDASSSEASPVGMEDFEKLTLGSNEFYRIKKGDDMRGQMLKCAYYLNAPIYGKALADLTDIIIFTVNAFISNDIDAGPRGERNASHAILREILSTLKVREK